MKLTSTLKRPHSLDSKGGFRLENGSASLFIWFDPRFDVQIENISYSPTFICVEKSKALVMRGDGDSLVARTKIEFGATQLMGASHLMGFSSPQ
jgi:hypothetical protein